MSVDEVTATPQLTLSGYAELWDAFRQRDLRQRLYEAGGVVMRDALLDLHGDEHRLRRRVENRLFRRGTFRLWEAELVPGVIQEAFGPALQVGRADLVRLGYRTTMALTARVAGADRTTGSVEETDALQRFAVTFSEGATLVHSTRDPAEVRAEVEDALRRFDALFFTPSHERRVALAADASVAEADLPRDVLMALVQHAGELGVDRDTMLREVAFYLQAGSHSTAAAFTHAVDEVLRWAGGDPDRARRLADDLFLQRCVHEAFRLHPASPVAERRALADVPLRDGRVVPAGTVVVMDIRTANRDPAVFGPDAGIFDPLRTVPDGVPPWGHTFGGGMHACIGMELDGGTVPTDPPATDHVLGTVTLMLRELLRHGVRPDPQHPPTRDPHSRREHFGSYPVLLGSP
ncbi:cytochrome P450 [Geodermatophilus sp. SYSU D00696]